MMPAGTLAVTRTYKYGGDFQSTRMHPECFEAMIDYCSDSEEEYFDGGKMVRGKPLHRDDLPEAD